MEPGITIANDDTVAELIQSANRELVVLAPALTEALARVVADRWQTLGASAVQVIVDSDPEVYRLGYGTRKAYRSSNRQHRRLAAFFESSPERGSPSLCRTAGP